MVNLRLETFPFFTEPIGGGRVYANKGVILTTSVDPWKPPGSWLAWGDSLSQLWPCGDDVAAGDDDHETKNSKIIS